MGLAFTVGKDEKTGLKNVIPDSETNDIITDFINHFLIHQSVSLVLQLCYVTRFQVVVNLGAFRRIMLQRKPICLFWETMTTVKLLKTEKVQSKRKLNNI